MRILGLIPARGGSKGVPHKNRKSLGGKPLVQYSIETALNCNLIHDVLVSTDDQEIAKMSVAAGAQVPFIRPDHLASDESPTIDTVLHALDYYKTQSKSFDAVCLFQPTVPFRNHVDVKNAIEKFIQKKADSLISVRVVPHQFHPYGIFTPNQDGYLSRLVHLDAPHTRRQTLPMSYYRDGSIYLTATSLLQEQRTFYGASLVSFIMKHSPNINIDTMTDWEHAERYILNRLAE